MKIARYPVRIGVFAQQCRFCWPVRTGHAPDARWAAPPSGTSLETVIGIRLQTGILRLFQTKNLPMSASRMAPAPSPIAAIGAYWRERHEATWAEQYTLQALANAAGMAQRNMQLYVELQRA